MIVANATGCSSIYGANLPTTPWTTDAEGRGPAWNNSLFEDNAEFGLGMRLGLDAQERSARAARGPGRRGRLRPRPVDPEERAGHRARDPRAAPHGRPSCSTGSRVVEGEHRAAAARLVAMAPNLIRQGVWLIGGDGWAYDIGFGGLDHVLSSGRNVNILVLDTEVYSNTGGQASKATQRGAVAKFAAAGKSTGKKDLGAIARSYGNVYVAQVSMGANELQTTKALIEADAWPGPSLVIAYSTCIAHGIDMSKSMTHQKDAVRAATGRCTAITRARSRTASPSSWTPGRPPSRCSDFVGLRDPLRHPAAHRPDAGPRAVPDAAGRRRRAVALLRAAGCHPPHHAVSPHDLDGDLSERRDGGRHRPHRRERDLTWPISPPATWASSSAPRSWRRRHRSTTTRHRQGGRGSRRLGHRHAVAVRGGDPPRGDRAEPSLEAGSEHFAEALDYFPDIDGFATPATATCQDRRAEGPGGWCRSSPASTPPPREVGSATPPSSRQAGADALELNLYHVAADPTRDAAAMEAIDLEIVHAVRAALSIPLAVKLSPHYSAFAHFAHQVVDAGADGLVLFNRFYQPDLDLDTLEVVHRVELSRPGELRLPMRWIAILRPQLGPVVSIAATSGIHSGTDVVKAVMVGADVAMLTSAVLRHGPDHLRTVEAQLLAWLTEHEYESVTQLRGSATQATSGDPSAFERANYLKTLHSWSAPHELTDSSPSS
jgi:pyruvate/2-oxoacid:ferredoxin oxidoreductase beta subunit